MVSEPALRRVSRETRRQRPVARHHEVGAEQQVRLRRQRALHAIGEEADGAHAADRKDERRDEHPQLARAPVAAEQAQREPQRDSCQATADCRARRDDARRPGRDSESVRARSAPRAPRRA